MGNIHGDVSRTGRLLAPAGTSEDALQAWDGSHMLLWAERVLSHLRRDTPVYYKHLIAHETPEHDLIPLGN